MPEPLILCSKNQLIEKLREKSNTRKLSIKRIDEEDDPLADAENNGKLKAYHQGYKDAVEDIIHKLLTSKMIKCSLAPNISVWDIKNQL